MNEMNEYKIVSSIYFICSTNNLIFLKNCHRLKFKGNNMGDIEWNTEADGP